MKTLTFPIASSALSKKRIIPKNRKNTPNPVNPIPISATEVKRLRWRKKITSISL